MRRLAATLLALFALATIVLVAYRMGHAVGAWERHDIAVAEANRLSRRVHDDAPLREADWLPSTYQETGTDDPMLVR